MLLVYVVVGFVAACIAWFAVVELLSFITRRDDFWRD
jgi:hypothetical protein